MAGAEQKLPAAMQHQWTCSSESNEILETCFRLAAGTGDPQQGLEAMLTYLGERSHSDRIFIFEKNETDNTVSNTFEWCREGVQPQQALLQRMPYEDTRALFEILEKKGFMVIQDLESLRREVPGLYSALKPQNIHSGATARILCEGRVVGFWGVDNMDPGAIPLFQPLVKDLEKLMESVVRSRNLRRELRDIDYRDPVTGFYNLKAIQSHNIQDRGVRSLAVVYARLEDDQDTDSLMLQVRGQREMFYSLMDTRRIYRISPTEFVAVYAGIEWERIDRRRKSLKMRMAGTGIRMRIGSAWSDEEPLELDNLIRTAVRWSYVYGADEFREKTAENGPLHQYLQKNYFDLEFFLNGLTNNNDSACYFFGDIQESVYYISENMRRKFGFSGCLVPELFYAWDDRIDGMRAKKRYRRDMRQILEKKQDSFNLYQQVRDASGHREWIHLYGELKWDPGHTKILFCAGRLAMQDKSLAVDISTHFSLEPVLVRHLTRIRQHGQICYFIGFSLNSIDRINDMKGRAFGNSLIRSVGEALGSQFYDRAAFYKLSGMRFVALIRPEFQEERQSLVEELRTAIEERYGAFEIQVPNPCSFVLTSYPREELEPLDFIENITSCINLVQEEGGRACLDGTSVDIRQLKAEANLSMDLGRDVINQLHHFRIVLQPVVTTEHNQVDCGETLLRWRHQGKDVSPGVFIPLLEKENLIIPVGRWVFEQAVNACRRILSLNPDFRLSVNVSLQQLDDEGFGEFIRRTLEKYQVDGKHIVLEMTESCMDTAQEKLNRLMSFCSGLGIEMALDDFGTGYSSLRVLMQYPMAVVKLDRSLLLEMGKSMDKKNFISAIVYACHQFGKRVCIEGVETGEQNRMVREAQCDMIQGFYYYRPMELEDVYSIMADPPAVED